MSDQTEDKDVEIARLKRQLEGKDYEIKILMETQEKFEEHLEEQFNAMQVALIGFVMYKCGRKNLVIDSREISQAPYTHQVVDVVVKDGYTTQYSVRGPR